MRLTIELELRYRFSEPAHHSIQYLRLTPRAESSQNAVSWRITTPGNLRRWIDGFGNIAHVSVQNGLHDEVPLLVRGEVDTFDTFGMLSIDDGLPPQMFIRASPLTQVNDAIEEWVKPYIERISDEGIIATLHALMHGLHTGVPHREDRTTITLTAAKALEQGAASGVDYSHVFIACCRALNIPARYVSGYLLKRQGNDPLLSTHAWAEAYVDDKVGWISFDPLHNQSATEDYVRLALAFDQAGAGTVRGVQKGGRVDEVKSSVQIS